MSEPWPQIHGFAVNSLSNPYARMMNTSGIAFKDHAGSMVLTPPLPNPAFFPLFLFSPRSKKTDASSV